MSIELVNDSLNFDAKICIIGVGGAGGNAVDNMIRRNLEDVSFITANTDKQALDNTLASEKLLLGANCTKGLGAGANPEIGKKATEESIDTIKNALEGYNLICITCGMGGGTGTGGSPIIAKIAKETGALVVGIVTKCFTRDGGKKVKLAEDGIAALKENVDSIIVVPNDKILEVCKGVRISEAYSRANDILFNAINGVTGIIKGRSLQNIDFADVRSTLTNAGDVIIGIGSSIGDNAAREAVEMALNSPFLDGWSIKDAERILVNIQAGNHSIEMIDEAYKAIIEAAGKDAMLITGEDEDESEEFTVTIIAPAKKTSTDKPIDELPPTKKPEVAIAQVETTAIPAKPKKQVSINSGNLFHITDNNLTDNIKSNDIFNPDNNKKPNLEVVSGTKIGRPHGDEELKELDEPAYRRKGLKYESAHSLLTDGIADTNTMPRPDDYPTAKKIQNMINDSAIMNRFTRQLSEKGLQNR